MESNSRLLKMKDLFNKHLENIKQKQEEDAKLKNQYLTK